MRSMMLAAAMVTLLGACSEPFIVFSGGALEGETVEPPASWSMLDTVDTVQLETQPEDPYSVNIWAAGIGPDVYVATGKDGTNWTKHIEANNNVRLRIDHKIFNLRASRVTDPEEIQRVSAAYVRKYGLDPDDNWVMKGRVYRLDRR